MKTRHVCVPRVQRDLGTRGHAAGQGGTGGCGHVHHERPGVVREEGDRGRPHRGGRAHRRLGSAWAGRRAPARRAAHRRLPDVHGHPRHRQRRGGRAARSAPPASAGGAERARQAPGAKPHAGGRHPAAGLRLCARDCAGTGIRLGQRLSVHRQAGGRHGLDARLRDSGRARPARILRGAARLAHLWPKHSGAAR